ncbi:AAA family ATPase [Vibrio atlanticus]|uniref:AAA family ATPase n=1 Tax=Vibrio atlanticus TaxID=693153 RepID=UPI003553B81C
MTKLPAQPELFKGSSGTPATKLDIYNDDFFECNGYRLTNTQLNAVSIALTNNFTVIDGYGGTGIKAVADLSVGERTPYIIALSCKAKERPKESTGLETFTIHAFINKLHNGKVSTEGEILVVIDEASMIDILLMNKLLKALDSTNFRLLMVGNHGQLPPIGFGLYFHHLVETMNEERTAHQSSM